MANICWFKGIIKGKEMNCEKFIEIFPCYDILDLKSVGCLQETAMAFCGTSAWGICAYADNEEKVIPLTEEAIATISDKDANQYSKYRLVDLAVLFDVEIMINSVCEDDVKVSNYEHYVRGYRLDDDLLSRVWFTLPMATVHSQTRNRIMMPPLFLWMMNTTIPMCRPGRLSWFCSEKRYRRNRV